MGELLFRFETTGFLGREFVVTRTTGGLVAEARGEVIEHPAGIEFEVIDADPRRIKRLRIRLPESAEG